MQTIMPKKLNLFLASITIFQLCNHSSYAQVIPEKKFTKTNSPVFLVNGFFNVSAGKSNQNRAFEKNYLPDGITKNQFNNSQSIGNDTQIYLKSGIMTESKTKYGAVAKFEYNYNTNHNRENPNLDSAFIYQENNFGKFEFGNNKAVNQQMKLGPARFARGAGGINGKYLEHINLSAITSCLGANCSNVKLPQFILLAQSPIGHGGYAQGNLYDANGTNQFNRSRFRALKDDSFDGAEDATKLSYFSPRIEGAQLGISYTPNTQNQGVTANTNYNLSSIRIEDVFSLGFNYSADFDNIGFGFSATAEKGTSKNYSANQAPRNNLFAYDLATTITYFGFTFGASYGSWTNSLQQKSGIYSCNYNSNLNLMDQNCGNSTKKFSDPKYYTAGIAYEIGPMAASITGIKTQFQNNNYQAISFGLDYKYKKDLMPYIELTKFAFTSNQVKAADINQRQIADNSGFVLLTGILLSF
jgi:hypothetical protein